LQVMDFGYPQFTEAKILSEFIKTDAHKMEVGLLQSCLFETLLGVPPKQIVPSAKPGFGIVTVALG